MMTDEMEGNNVRFGQIEIIELPYTLGDNPSVSCGPPVAASWESQKRTKLNLEFFEEFRPSRRNKNQLHLSKEARIKLLLQSGHSMTEIKKATASAIHTRRLRLDTINEYRERVQVALDAYYGSGSPASCGRRNVPPSPIIPRRTIYRRDTSERPSLTHLRFPCPEESVLSPRTLPRKRQNRDFDNPEAENSLSSDIYNHTPKRIRSPLEPSMIPVSPVRKGGPVMRLSARVRSPIPDKRPLVQPRRIASPQTSMLYTPSPKRAM